MRIYARTLAGAVIAALVLLGAFSNARTWPEMPPDKAFISGPGIEGNIEITDKAVLKVLRIGGIEDFGWGPIQQPKGIGQGFHIIRFFEDGEFRMGDLTYYPNGVGVRSVLFYDDGGMVNGDRSPNHKKWLYALSSSDRVLQGYLKSLGATFTKMKVPEKEIIIRAQADALPKRILVGEQATIEFSLSNASASALVVLKPDGDSKRIVIPAQSTGAPGHYQFQHTFKTSGIWDWSVQADYDAAEIPMESLLVIKPTLLSAPGDNRSIAAARDVDEASAALDRNRFGPELWGIAGLAGIFGILGLAGVVLMASRRAR